MLIPSIVAPILPYTGDLGCMVESYSHLSSNPLP